VAKKSVVVTTSKAATFAFGKKYIRFPRLLTLHLDFVYRHDLDLDAPEEPAAATLKPKAIHCQLKEIGAKQHGAPTSVDLVTRICLLSRSQW
jgi:hypothetical protein